MTLGTPPGIYVGPEMEAKNNKNLVFFVFPWTEIELSSAPCSHHHRSAHHPVQHWAALENPRQPGLSLVQHQLTHPSGSVPVLFIVTPVKSTLPDIINIQRVLWACRICRIDRPTLKAWVSSRGKWSALQKG